MRRVYTIQGKSSVLYISMGIRIGTLGVKYRVGGTYMGDDPKVHIYLEYHVSVPSLELGPPHPLSACGGYTLACV